MANLDQYMGDLVSRISEPTVMAAGNFAKRIPSILISFIVTIISAYFFIADRENIILWAKKIFPKPIVERMTMVTDNLKYAVGGYFKAQFKIMAVVFAILLVALGSWACIFPSCWPSASLFWISCPSSGQAPPFCHGRSMSS